MKIRGEIASIAVPAIVTNITTPLLGLADIAITGHIGEAAYIAAIALGGTLFDTLYWLFNFLRMGTTGITAQAFGRGKGTGAAFGQSMTVALAIGVLLLVFGRFICTHALALMDADDAAQSLATRYTDILVWGAPAMLGTYAAVGWLIGMQDTRRPMVIAIVTNLINIGASCLLVFGLGWSIEGVAAGTLIAQWCGFILACAMIWTHYRKALAIRGLRVPLKRYFSLNTDIFLRTVCLVAVTLWFTHAGAVEGTDILAANALLLQLFLLFSFFMDGFAYAAEALSGKYFGLTDKHALSSMIRSLNKVGIACALIFAVFYLGVGESILALLTDRPEIVAIAKQYLPWAVAVPLCGYLAFLYDGILVGLMRTRAMLASMGAAIVVFFGLYFGVHTTMHNHGLWLAFNAYLLTRGIVEIILLRRKPALR